MSRLPVLQIEQLNLGLAHNYQGLVHDLSLSLYPGDTLALVGESGSGKSLTALAIMGLLPPAIRQTGGEIYFGGEALSQDTMAQRRARRGATMSMIFQEPMTSLNPVMTVGRQVEEVLEIHTNLSPQARQKRVAALFKAVQLTPVASRQRAYPHELSGGQRQRVMIAMALAMNIKLLIADEPTTALDVTVQQEILTLLKKLQRQHQLAVLFITHDLSLVQQVADQVVVLQQGHAVEQGPVAQVLQRPRHAYTRQLLAAMPGQRQNLPHAGAQKPRQAPLLAVQNLSKTFQVRQGGFFSRPQPLRAVDDISFALYPGETLAVVGESGSGKSTLAKLILQLLKPDQGPEKGQVIFAGQDLTAYHSDTQLRPYWRQMQMVFQDPYGSFNPRQKVGESVGEGLRAHQLLPRAEQRAFVTELLAECGLPADSYDRYPHEFSGGQRQRLCIARAIAMRPRLVIADEPVSALDVSVQKQILDLLQKFKTKYGLSYIFITHDLRVVQDIADRVLVMRRGAVVESGTVHQVFTRPQQAYTRALLNAVPGRLRLLKAAKSVTTKPSRQSAQKSTRKPPR